MDISVPVTDRLTFAPSASFHGLAQGLWVRFDLKGYGYSVCHKIWLQVVSHAVILARLLQASLILASFAATSPHAVGLPLSRVSHLLACAASLDAQARIKDELKKMTEWDMKPEASDGTIVWTHRCVADLSGTACCTAPSPTF